MFPCLVTAAENNHSARLESSESRRDANEAALYEEFMAAAAMPLLATVHTPSDRLPFQRTAIVDEFFDLLCGASKNRNLAARAISVLLRHDRDLVEELAAQHARDYEEFVQ